MSTIAAIDQGLLRQWMADGLDLSAVEGKIQSLLLEPEIAGQYVKEYKKLKHARRQTRGFIWASLGALAGFISCMLSIFNPIPEMFNIILYGLTSVAITMIVVGLYFLFE